MLQLTGNFVDSWRLTREIIGVGRKAISLSWASSQRFRFSLRYAGRSKIVGRRRYVVAILFVYDDTRYT